MRRLRRWLCPVLAVLLGLAVGTTPWPASAAATQFDLVHALPGGATSIVSTAPGEVWVSGRDGNDAFVLEHYASGVWDSTTLPGVTSGTLAASAPTDVWLNAGDSFRHWNGTDWQPVNLPTLPPGAELAAVSAMFDAPGPTFYAGFSYVLDGSTRIALGRYSGTSWTLLGAPEGDVTFESVQQIAVVNTVLVVRAATYRDSEQYIFRYESGSWSEPVLTGRYFCCSFNQWASDWVVNSATDIWLYGNFSDDNTASRAWCGHYNGTGLDIDPCVSGSGEDVAAAARLPDGSHLVGGGQFDLLRQPDQQARVEGEGAVLVRQLVAEPETGVVWALATQNGLPGTAVLRYGPAADAGQYAVTAEAAPSVERGEVVTVRGRFDPVPDVAAERGIGLQVKSGTEWTRVAANLGDGDGSYRFDVEQPKSGTFTYRVKKFASGNLAVGYSTPFEVRVLSPYMVSIRASTKVKAGRPAIITGRVTPADAAPGQRTVELQSKSAKGWRPVATKSTDAAGIYRFTVTGTKPTRYRVMKAGTDRRPAYSPVTHVKVVP